jgi:Flp pilus assembly protein TadD
MQSSILRSVSLSVCQAAMLLSANALWQSPALADETESVVQHAQAIVQQGQVENGIALLERRIAEAPDDLDTRLYLGRLLDFDGRPEEAVKVWQAGTTDDKPNADLLMAIGQVRNRQGKDGPGMSYRRGIFTAKGKLDKSEEAKFKREHFELAANAFEGALAAGNTDPRLVVQIAIIDLNLGKTEAAEELLRKHLKTSPNETNLNLQLAYTLDYAGKKAEAAAQFEKALELAPRDTGAHRRLANYYSNSEPERSQAHARQARFYDWLPEFCSIEFSDANFAIFEKLASNEAVGKPANTETIDRSAVIDELAAEDSPTALAFLAAICWRHEDHGALENKAFAALRKNPKVGVPLLKMLLTQAQTTCSVKEASYALAAIKDPEALDLIAPLLPQDTRFMFDMDLAGALTALGDPRAVAPLIKMANPTFRQEIPEKDDMEQERGRLLARFRAALALGTFDTQESRDALTQGLDNPQMALACHAALYRLTKAKEHLAAIEAAFTQDKDDACYLIATALEKDVDASGAELAKKWKAARKAEYESRQQQRDEERRARKATKEKEKS